MLPSIFVALFLAPSQTPAPPAPEPEMRVVVRDLNMADPAHADLFLRRVRQASRAFCAQHIAVVTPDRLGSPEICEAEMRRLAMRTLPETMRADLQRARRTRVVR